MRYAFYFARRKQFFDRWRRISKILAGNPPRQRPRETPRRNFRRARIMEEDAFALLALPFITVTVRDSPAMTQPSWRKTKEGPRTFTGRIKSKLSLHVYILAKATYNAPPMQLRPDSARDSHARDSLPARANRGENPRLLTRRLNVLRSLKKDNFLSLSRTWDRSIGGAGRGGMIPSQRGAVRRALSSYSAPTRLRRRRKETRVLCLSPFLSLPVSPPPFPSHPRRAAVVPSFSRPLSAASLGPTPFRRCSPTLPHDNDDWRRRHPPPDTCSSFERFAALRKPPRRTLRGALFLSLLLSEG